MRGRLAGILFATLALGAVATAADAKKFRYASGPKASEDSTLSVADPYLDPVVGSKGPKVPYTNLQLTGFVADSAVAVALAPLPLEPGVRVVLAPTREHPLNFVIEDAMIEHLTRRGLQVTVRRTPVPDDSLAVLFAESGDPIVEYTLASAKITYLRLIGYLPGRVKIERQSMVQGSLGLREPSTARVLWTNRMAQNFVDRIPKSQVSVVEDPRFPELKDTVPDRNADKVFEPVLVVAVIAGLVALFFQNRP
jgi:hypothetical protein